MDLSRLGRGHMIAAGSALALLLIMFIAWFGLSQDDAEERFESGDITLEEASEAASDYSQLATSTGDSVNINAWEAFSWIDLLLLLTIIAALAMAALAATQRRVDLPVALSAIVTGLAILSLILVIYRVINPVSIFGRELGLWLGLLATAGIAFGAWKAMQEEGTSFSDARHDLQGRGGGGTGGGSPPAASAGGAPPAGGGTAGGGTAPGGTGGGATPPPPGSPPAPPRAG